MSKRAVILSSSRCGATSRKSGTSSLAESTAGRASKSDTPPKPQISIPNNQLDAQDSQHTGYSAAISRGVACLGIDIPASLHQALLDQHGNLKEREYKYKGVAGGLKGSMGLREIALSPGINHSPSNLKNRVGSQDLKRKYEFAEIGSQFDGYEEVYIVDRS
jgi:hypothetical protein